MPGSMSQFYAGRTLFLTGGSGFLGKQMIEKLLRSCPAIDQIYVLIRTKKGKSPEERIDQLFQSPVFNRLKAEQPKHRRKVTAVAGDILLPGLGISDADRTKIENNASIFIHSAASLNFTEPLRNAVETNILPTRKMLHLAKSAKSCDAFIHVSTAYSQIDKSFINEQVYDAPIDPYRLFKMIELLDDTQLAALTPGLLGKRPNTYTFTKAVAEKLVDMERGEVPVAIVRPSIITASYAEPFKGWVDNYSAATGMLAGYALGTIRHVLGEKNLKLDLVPIDMTCNAVLAAARHAALNRKDQVPFVLNYNSMTINPFPLEGLCKIFTEEGRKERSTKYMGFMRPYLTIAPKSMARHFNYHISLPLRAQFLDFLAKMTGQKPRAVKVQGQFKKLQEVLEYFCLNEFNWEAGNAQKLIDGLTERDRKDFNFDVRTIDWHKYHVDYWFGIRQYLLKETLNKSQAVEQTQTSKQSVEPSIEMIARPAISHSMK